MVSSYGKQKTTQTETPDQTTTTGAAPPRSAPGRGAVSAGGRQPPGGHRPGDQGAQGQSRSPLACTRAALVDRSPFPRRRGNPGAGGAAGAPGVSQPLAAPTGAPAPPRRRNAPAHGPRTGSQTGAQRRSCPGPKAPRTQVLAPVGAPRQRRSLGGRWAYRSRAQQPASGASAGCGRRAAQAGRPVSPANRLWVKPMGCGSFCCRWQINPKFSPAARYASERAAAPHLAENPIVAYYAGVVAFRAGDKNTALPIWQHLAAAKTLNSLCVSS